MPEANQEQRVVKKGVNANIHLQIVQCEGKHFQIIIRSQEIIQNGCTGQKLAADKMAQTSWCRFNLSQIQLIATCLSDNLFYFLLNYKLGTWKNSFQTV